MAFEVSGGTVVLEFTENTVLHGATVKCSLDVSVRQFMELQRQRAQLRETADIEQMEAVFRVFGDIAIREWDLVMQGEPLPATGEGLLKLSFAQVLAIFTAWSQAMAGESPNSSSASPSGSTLEQAQSVAMEA